MTTRNDDWISFSDLLMTMLILSLVALPMMKSQATAKPALEATGAVTPQAASPDDQVIELTVGGAQISGRAVFLADLNAIQKPVIVKVSPGVIAEEIGHLQDALQHCPRVQVQFP